MDIKQAIKDINESTQITPYRVALLAFAIHNDTWGLPNHVKLHDAMNQAFDAYGLEKKHKQGKMRDYALMYLGALLTGASKVNIGYITDKWLNVPNEKE